MEKQRGFWIRAVLLLAVLNSALAEDKLSYFVVGGDLVLRPPFSGSITNILWKHDGNLVAEWVADKVPLDYYGKFKGRSTLNLGNAHLEIKNMSKADSGLYTVEINNKVQNLRYDVKVIREVPKPVVWVRPLSCSAALESCTLTCDGKAEEAEPVTYSWRMGDGEWEQSGKDKIITKTEIKDAETFKCQMKNPVSEKESEPTSNPFYVKPVPPEGQTAGTVIGIILGIVLVGCVVGLGIWKKDTIRKFISRSDDSTKPNEIVSLKQPETAPLSSSPDQSEDHGV